MFFTRVLIVVAKIGGILGLLRIATGSFVALVDDPAERAAAAARYLGHRSSGEAIDQGLIVVVVAVALGAIAEISRSLANLSANQK